VLNDGAFAAAGLDRRVALKVIDVRSAADYVRCGLGVALLPRTGGGDADGLAVIPVRGADLGWPLAIAYNSRRRPSAATRALAEVFGRL
jgi:DNA-binding transcriptional LysR family regulator